LVLRDFLFVSLQTSISHKMLKRSTLAMVQVVLLWDAASISGAVKSTATIKQAEIEAFEVSPQARFKAHKDEDFEDGAQAGEDEDFEVGAQAGKASSIEPEDCHICCQQPPAFNQASWARSDKTGGRRQQLNCKPRQGAPKKCPPSSTNKKRDKLGQACKKAPCQLIVDQSDKKGCNFEQFIENECKKTCDVEPPPTIDEVELSADMYAAMSRGDKEKAEELHQQLMEKVDERFVKWHHKQSMQKVHKELKAKEAKETFAKQMENLVKEMETAVNNHTAAKEELNNASWRLMKIQEAEEQAAIADEENTGNFITRFINKHLFGVKEKDRPFVNSELAGARNRAEAAKAVKEAREEAEKKEEILVAALEALQRHQASKPQQDGYDNILVQKFIDKQKKFCKESCNARFGKIPFFSPISFRDFFQEVPPPRSST